jgi:alpha-glucosidase
MFKKISCKWHFFTVLWLILPSVLFGKYQFLGNMQSYTLLPQGIEIICEDNVKLTIQFYNNNFFRVTLHRPEIADDLLTAPLANIPPHKFDLQITEEDLLLRISTQDIEVLVLKMPVRITVMDKQGRVINRDDLGMGIGWDGDEVRNWKTLMPGERFYGLGEKTGNLNKYRREWVMWNSDNPGYSDQTDPLYQSIPFYIGINQQIAYGIYFNNSYRTVFNFGAGNERYSSFAADGGMLDYFFIYGPEIQRVVTTYSEITGRQFLPPQWALGYQQCRWSYYPDKEVLNLAKTFREKQIPADVIYLDIHYMDGYRVFSWDRNRFPNPIDMMNQLHDLGFKVVTIIDPGVKQDSTYRVAKSGVTGEHFVKYPDGEYYIGEVWPSYSFFPDFSRVATREWWGNYLAEMMDTGVDGFWNDMNEPAVWGKAFPTEVLMYDDGKYSSFKKMRNLYAFYMAQATYAAFKKHRPNQRPFIVTRAGFAGEQRLTTVWTGDNSATWDDLALGIRMMLGMGLSGVPFVGMDVGGFIGTPTPELFARWVQVGTFSPFFRTHTHFGSPDQEPWSFGENVEAISKKFIELRYQLLPYLYTLLWESTESGSPIVRPLFWHYQNDPNTFSDEFQHQFMVGENLLVVPVLRPGQQLQKVYLPKGKWYDMNSGKTYSGGRTVIVATPLDQIPMFLKDGGIITLQPTAQYVGDAAAANRLTVKIFTDQQYGSFMLYEDDGKTNAFRGGQYRLTRFEVIPADGGIRISRNVVADGYTTPVNRMIKLELLNVAAAPQRVSLANKALNPLESAQLDSATGYRYDDQHRRLTIQFPETNATQIVFVK